MSYALGGGEVVGPLTVKKIYWCFWVQRLPCTDDALLCCWMICCLVLHGKHSKIARGKARERVPSRARVPRVRENWFHRVSVSVWGCVIESAM